MGDRAEAEPEIAVNKSHHCLNRWLSPFASLSPFALMQNCRGHRSTFASIKFKLYVLKIFVEIRTMIFVDGETVEKLTNQL